MTSNEAIEYLRQVTTGDARAQEALDCLTLLGQTANVLAKLHEASTDSSGPQSHARA